MTIAGQGVPTGPDDQGSVPVGIYNGAVVALGFWVPVITGAALADGLGALAGTAVAIVWVILALVLMDRANKAGTAR